MWQDNVDFINVWNRFRTASQIATDIKLLVGLCAKNYETLDGLVNGVDGYFKIIQKLFQNL
jgi:hypothetical protein